VTRALVVASLVVLAACRSDPTPVPDSELGEPPGGDPGRLVRAHSHNDYEQPRALLDALDQRFYSVEADLWLEDGEVLVSHEPWDYAGGLKTLYLDKLQERVDAWGSVYGDGATFYLWLDLKTGDAGLRDALFALLDPYTMLTRYTPAGVEPAPVVAILTGDAQSKRAFISEHPERRATRDGHTIADDDPPASGDWGFYAFNWNSTVGWDGTGTLPDDASEALEALVSGAHDKGRKVRFWNLPDHEGGWQAALDAGVDFINTDRLAPLAAFLRSAR
jgi:hypothetical protein